MLGEYSLYLKKTQIICFIFYNIFYNSHSEFHGYMTINQFIKSDLFVIYST